MRSKDVSAAQIINEFMEIPNHDLEANISVGSGAIINGGDVSLTATTADNNWYQDFGTTGQEITSVLSTFLMPVINNLIDLPVSVQYDSATSTAEIGQSASITSSGSVTVSTSATANATGQAVWSMLFSLLSQKTGVGVTFAYDEANSDAESTVDQDATITAAGDVSITSETTTTTSGTAEVVQNTNTSSSSMNLNNVQVSGAINELNTTSHAVVSQGATISSSGGNVAVTATASDSDEMTVETASYYGGRVGLTFGWGNVNADVKATVDGTITAGGSNPGITSADISPYASNASSSAPYVDDASSVPAQPLTSITPTAPSSLAPTRVTPPAKRSITARGETGQSRAWWTGRPTTPSSPTMRPRRARPRSTTCNWRRAPRTRPAGITSPSRIIPRSTAFP